MGTFPNAPYYFGGGSGGSGGSNAALSLDSGRQLIATQPISGNGGAFSLDGGGAATPLQRLDLVGVDPNDAMEDFARNNLAKAVGGSSRAGGAAAPVGPKPCTLNRIV